jgi:nitrous oxide reductase
LVTGESSQDELDQLPTQPQLLADTQSGTCAERELDSQGKHTCTRQPQQATTTVEAEQARDWKVGTLNNLYNRKKNKYIITRKDQLNKFS